MCGFDFKNIIQVFEHSGGMYSLSEFLVSKFNKTFEVIIATDREVNLWERCNIYLINGNYIKNAFLLNGRYCLYLSLWKAADGYVAKDAFQKYCFILKGSIFDEFNFVCSDIKKIIINNEFSTKTRFVNRQIHLDREYITYLSNYDTIPFGNQLEIIC
jgi:hypothetical protein